MRNELTDSQIALLCDIEEANLTKFMGDKRRDLERLLSEGYVEPTSSHPGSAFKLTTKGADFLGERGAGLSEA
jgi:CTP-dependent riboflavin kinase